MASKLTPEEVVQLERLVRMADSEDADVHEILIWLAEKGDRLLATVKEVVPT